MAQQDACEAAQVLFPAKGVVSVRAGTAVALLSVRSAVWVPPGMSVEISCRRSSAVCRVMIGVQDLPNMPAALEPVIVSPLLRALLLEAARIPDSGERSARDGLLLQLLRDELCGARTAALLHLRMPDHPRLLRVCEAVVKEPRRSLDLTACGRAAGVSRRTFTRLFAAEMEMTFGEWRRQVRLVEALSGLARGRSVTSVALDAGYRSPAAFNAMFRRATGVAPSQYGVQPSDEVDAGTPMSQERRTANAYSRALPNSVPNRGAREAIVDDGLPCY